MTRAVESTTPTQSPEISRRAAKLHPLLRQSVKQAKQLRISWTSGLLTFGGTLLIGGVLEHFGRFDLATPTCFSAIAIGFAIATKWELKGHFWFWITMTVIAALHVPLILLVPWTTKWVPAVVIAPFVAADLYAMLVILAVSEKFMARRKALGGI